MKTSDTTFTVPQPDKEVDVKEVLLQKDKYVASLAFIQSKIDECDALLAQATKVGIDIIISNQIKK